MVKSFGFMRKKKGLTQEQFVNHWINVHAPMIPPKKVPGLRKYIQNYPAPGMPARPEFESGIDGIAEMWFDDVESLVAFQQWLNTSDEAKDLQEDSAKFLDFDEGIPFVFVAEEHVTIG